MKKMLHKVILTAMMLSFTATMSAQQPYQATYSVRGNQVMCEGRVMPGADAPSFQVLGFGYAKDRYNVYLDGQILRFVDPQSFRLLPPPSTGNTGHGHVNPPAGNLPHHEGEYYNMNRPNNAGNGNHLGHVGGAQHQGHHGNAPTYMTDNFNVYFDGRKVQGASANSFKDLGYGYGKDAFNAYYYGEKIAQSSGSSFELLRDGYSHDAFRAFYQGRVINGSSGNSFTVLGDGYSKDAFNVYYNGEKVQGASANSFKLKGQGYASDAFNSYYCGRKM